VQSDERPFGLIVDGVNDTEEIVVKPLAKQLKGVTVFAGATIMGDGKVSLILDVSGLAERSAVTSGHEARQSGSIRESGRAAEQVSHLLVAGAGSRRVAIPLALVSRLEEIPASAIETADGQEVIQYSGRIMPLIRLGDLLGVGSVESGNAKLQVVVYKESGRSVGIVVDAIHDVAETALEITAPGRRRGVIGSGVIQGRVTDLLDLSEIVRSAVPEFSVRGQV
jgi:two-component system chemotaxis sensor kinase CheA